MSGNFSRAQAADRRAVDLEHVFYADNPHSDTRVASDTRQTGGTAELSWRNTGTVVTGRIVDAIAYARSYKVACEKGYGTLICCDAAHTSLTLVGAKQLNTYSLGSCVLVYVHPHGAYGVILCAIPDWLYDPRFALSDFVAQGSGVGLSVDLAHNAPFNLPANGMIVDFSAGRPFDSLPVGEWGAFAETGVGVFSDPMMAFIRVDEETGLFTFYQDQLTRLAGHNLQIRSSGFEQETFDDRGELSSVIGFSPYAWEALGLYSRGTTATRSQTTEATQISSAQYAKLEPAHDDQMPFHREMHFHGYLGQGGKVVVAAPNTSAPGGIHRLSSSHNARGVFEQFVGVDGTYALRTAHGAYCIKYPLIPAPKQKKKPEDPTGDRAANYKSAGVTGGGSNHVVEGSVQGGGSSHHLLSTAAVLDQVAYIFNWKGDHPFHYHTNDWYLPDESDLDAASAVASATIPFGDLETATYLPLPSYFDMEIDSRYGATRYYANAAGWCILPTGGIVIFDGFGSQIRMLAGNIEITAAGDVSRFAGRNTVDIAGWDAIVKANNCADVSANNGDVRVKADGEVFISGGNGGCGGVLIETKAQLTGFLEDAADSQVTGILLRAKNSTIVGIAESIVLDTAIDLTGGRIVLNAGSGNIFANSANHYVSVASNINHIFAAEKVNVYTKDLAYIKTKLAVAEPAYFLKCVTAVERVVVGQELSARSYHTLTPEITADIAVVAAVLAAFDSSAIISAVGDVVSHLAVRSDVATVEFVFREPAAYLTTNYQILEPMWAQYSRIGSGDALNVWVDNAVAPILTSGSDTAAYPGYAPWYSNSSYKQSDLVLYSAANNRAEDRGGALYENPTFDAFTAVTPQNNWPVLVNPES